MNTILTGFSYDDFPVELQETLRQATSELRSLARTTVQSAFRIGEVLIAIRPHFPTARAFNAYINQEMQWSVRSAAYFTSIYRCFKEAPDAIELMSQHAAYMLSAAKAPASARTEAIAIARSGTKVNTQVARKVLQEHNAQRYPQMKRSQSVAPLANGPREDVLVRLQQEPGDELRQRIQDAFNRTCAKCGMTSSPLVCRECPLPKFFRQLLPGGQNE